MPWISIFFFFFLFFSITTYLLFLTLHFYVYPVFIIFLFPESNRLYISNIPAKTEKTRQSCLTIFLFVHSYLLIYADKRLQIAARIDRTSFQKFLIRSPLLPSSAINNVDVIRNKIRRLKRQCLHGRHGKSLVFSRLLIAFLPLPPRPSCLSFVLQRLSTCSRHPSFPLLLAAVEWCKTIDSIPGRLVLTSFLSARFIEELRTLSVSFFLRSSFSLRRIR